MIGMREFPSLGDKDVDTSCLGVLGDFFVEEFSRVNPRYLADLSPDIGDVDEVDESDGCTVLNESVAVKCSYEPLAVPG